MKPIGIEIYLSGIYQGKIMMKRKNRVVTEEKIHEEISRRLPNMARRKDLTVALI